MLLTEQEAKARRCQESFAAANGISPDGSSHVGMVPTTSTAMGGGPSYAVHTAPQMCIATGCMAWRWRGWRQDDGRINPNRATFPDNPRVGYCGKAGEPIQ